MSNQSRGISGGRGNLEFPALHLTPREVALLKVYYDRCADNAGFFHGGAEELGQCDELCSRSGKRWSKETIRALNRSLEKKKAIQRYYYDRNQQEIDPTKASTKQLGAQVSLRAVVLTPAGIHYLRWTFAYIHERETIRPKAWRKPVFERQPGQAVSSSIPEGTAQALDQGTHQATRQVPDQGTHQAALLKGTGTDQIKSASDGARIRDLIQQFGQSAVDLAASECELVGLPPDAERLERILAAPRPSVSITWKDAEDVLRDKISAGSLEIVRQAFLTERDGILIFTDEVPGHLRMLLERVCGRVLFEHESSTPTRTRRQYWQETTSPRQEAFA